MRSWTCLLLLALAAPAHAKSPPPVYDGGSVMDAFMEGFEEGMKEGMDEGKSSAAPGEPEMTDDEAAAMGLGGICCCFSFLVGAIILVVVLVKKSQSAKAAPAAPPSPFAPPGGTHLSVVAVAFDARMRGAIEGALRSAGAIDPPSNTASRALMVRTLCRALLDASENWRAFGYGDKTDFSDDGAAEQSFRAAWGDFRGRCQGAGVPGGELCVAVLVLCSRGAVLGTSKLEDPVQARALLQHRMGIATESFLAADCFFAPLDANTGALSGDEAYRRFPEMQPLGPR